MNYQGYLSKNEVLKLVEDAFPFVDRPTDNELYIVEDGDLLRGIIGSNISNYTGSELSYEGVISLYDEFSSLSQKAVQWVLPSMLRIILTGRDRSDNLHGSLPWYLEVKEPASSKSAFDFSWLSKAQINALNCLLEFLSEVYDDDVVLAQEALSELDKNNV